MNELTQNQQMNIIDEMSIEDLKDANQKAIAIIKEYFNLFDFQCKVTLSIRIFKIFMNI
jgi:hypothetical protein